MGGVARIPMKQNRNKKHNKTRQNHDVDFGDLKPFFRNKTGVKTNGSVFFWEPFSGSKQAANTIGNFRRCALQNALFVFNNICEPCNVSGYFHEISTPHRINRIGIFT